MLEKLEKANLFIVAMDDRRCWYRYHHLFSDLLRQKLHQKYPSSANDLHLRASRWFEENGLLHEGVGHAIEAKDFKRAASLIEKELCTIWENSEYIQLWRWINILPSSLVDSRPELCFGIGVFLNSTSLVLIFTPLYVILNVWELKYIEEPELAKRLGNVYIEYRRKTPMFIPGRKMIK